MIEDKNYISMDDFCKRLGISIATCKNWIKLNKITPDTIDRNNYYFTEDNFNKISTDIRSGKLDLLKGRRNKKYVKGNEIYKDYISQLSPNYETVVNTINYIIENSISLTDEIICRILADCAKKLIYSRETLCYNSFALNTECDSLIKHNEFNFLLNELYNNIQNNDSIKTKYPQLCEGEYTFIENEDTLGFLYISLKCLKNRKATGMYYTPAIVVKKLCNNLFCENDVNNKTIYDPCCGTGNFLLQLPNNIKLDNIYAGDIDEISTILTKINLALKFRIYDVKILSTHVKKFDFLLEDNCFHKKFDYIIGNPPWGFEFSNEHKDILKSKYQCIDGASIESYDLFIESALKYIKKDGIISFVLPEALLSVRSHYKIRQLLFNNCSIQFIEYLGNVFNKVQCPAIILQVKNSTVFSTKNVKISTGATSFTIQNERNIDASNFWFKCNDIEYSILNKIDNLNNVVFLKDNATFALGIVTGNNKKYVTNNKTSDNEIIVKGADIVKYEIKNKENYIEFVPNKFQQVAPVQYYRAPEKLLYRFISKQLVFAYDDKKTLSLNSCNILIPHIDYLNIKYILAVLNSTVCQFIFEKKYNSVKVLRSHLEEIPIPYVDEMEQKSIISLVEMIMSVNNDEKKYIYNELDYKIAIIYGLNDNEYKYIKELYLDYNNYL